MGPAGDRELGEVGEPPTCPAHRTFAVPGAPERAPSPLSFSSESKGSDILLLAAVLHTHRGELILTYLLFPIVHPRSNNLMISSSSLCFSSASLCV